MNLKRWAILLALAAGMLILFSGCGIQDRFIAQNEPTPTNTRRPRPTFTPRPQATETPLPTDTVAATDVPTDTPAPTKAPVKATAKPKATNPPPPPPQPTAIPPTAAPTKPPFTYLFTPTTCTPGDGICNVQAGVKCFHAGSHYIDAVVYANYRDPGSALAGIKVRFSFSPGGAPIDPDELSGDDGKAEKTLSAVTDPPTKNTGTFFAWVIDSQGNRQSDYSPAININAKGEDDPTVCWAAKLAFTGGH